ncbi:MAG: RNA polymerase sigma factor [Armatimonadetes bacterium]|nr:RNA polymerase sigma factor [Armatimonadota bacterium]MDW8120761.1 RNA polymerase sigma factor [Armatimonadota bacterium]
MSIRWKRAKDEELVILTLAGELEAFGELARRYRPCAQAVAFAVVGNREEAEDIAEDGLLTALKALPMLKNPARFASWLCAITRHRAYKVARHRSRWKREGEGVPFGDLMAAWDEERIKDLQRRLGVQQALSRIPTIYREVLSLRYYGSQSLKDISRCLGIPVTTVKWRLHEGRRLLREALFGKEFMHKKMAVKDKEGC